MPEWKPQGRSASQRAVGVFQRQDATVNLGDPSRTRKSDPDGPLSPRVSAPQVVPWYIHAGHDARTVPRKAAPKNQ